MGTDDEMTPRVQLGSVPYAVQALTIPDGSVTTAKIANGAVKTTKIANGAVTQSKLGADVGLDPPDGSVTTVKIADGAVTEAKLDPLISLEPDYSFGGMYTYNPHTGACQSNNPFTSACTCPAGYDHQIVGTIDHGELSYDCNGLFCITEVCYKQGGD